MDGRSIGQNVERQEGEAQMDNRSNGQKVQWTENRLKSD